MLDPSDWFLSGNWNNGIPNAAVAATIETVAGAVVNVNGHAEATTLHVGAPSGSTVKLSVASGSTLTTSGIGNYSTVANGLVIVDVQGALTNRGNNAFIPGFNQPNAVAIIQGGGIMAHGGGNFSASAGQSVILRDNTTLAFTGNIQAGRVFFTNSVVTSGNNFYVTGTSVFHGMTVTNNGAMVRYANTGGYVSSDNALVSIMNASTVYNNGLPTEYCGGVNATVLIAEGSTVTDARNVLIFQDNGNSGRRLIVDNATYRAINATSTVNSGNANTGFTDNWVIVRNGAVFSFANVMNFGPTVDVATPNGIEVDNSTFSGGSLNLRNNSILDIKGEYAEATLSQLTCSNTTAGNEPTIKFTIPAVGFKDVPLTLANAPGAGMNLNVDASALVMAGGGRVALIEVAAAVQGLDGSIWNSVALGPSPYVSLDVETVGGSTILYADVIGGATTLTFNHNNGTGDTTTQSAILWQDAGNSFYTLTELPPTPTYAGHVLAKWVSALTGDDAVVGGNYPAADNAFDAVWGAEVAITFNYQDDATTPNTATAKYPLGYAFGPLPMPTYYGHIFIEWNEASDGTGAAITAGSIVNNTVTDYYAIWYVIPTAATWTGNSLADDTDWFLHANWSPGVPGFLTAVTISKNGATVNVSNNVNVASVAANPAGSGDGVTISIPQGVTLASSAAGVYNNAGNSAPVVLDIAGTLIHTPVSTDTYLGTGGNTRFVLQGGGTFRQDNRQLFVGDNAGAMPVFRGGIKLLASGNANYARGAFTNSLIVNSSYASYAKGASNQSGQSVTLHGMTVTNGASAFFATDNPDSGSNSWHLNSVGSRVTITANSKVHNRSTTAAVGYAGGTNATVIVEDGSVLTDVGPVTIFPIQPRTFTTASGRRFIVDGATYESTSATITVGGVNGADFCDNWVIVRNSGTFSFANAMNVGTTVNVAEPNGIKVDNATFTGGSLTLRNNAELDIKGADAVVKLSALSSADTIADNVPVVRFTVPQGGFEDAPLTVSGTLAQGMTLAVDATAYRPSGSGRVPILAVAGDVQDLATTAFWRGLDLKPAGASVAATAIELNGAPYTLLYLKTILPTMILVK